jgi:hypothetical protein
MTTAGSLCMPSYCPPRPSFVVGLPPPRELLLRPLRRRLKKLVFGAIDGGWFGLRPLKSHVVVCGFPRSGSTLLLLMMETCVSDARTFGEEVPALWAAQYALRNHSFLITKDPFDVFFLNDIRSFHADRGVDARFVITVRDPRAVLTSRHARHPDRQPGGYYESPESWLAFYQQVRYVQRSGDAMTVRYEDLVSRPAQTQRGLTEFIGWNVHLPIEQFHTQASPEFKDTFALNGVRPLERSRVTSWRQPEHYERMRHLLQVLPDLPEYVIELGYETNTEWTWEYL